MSSDPSDETGDSGAERALAHTEACLRMHAQGVVLVPVRPTGAAVTLGHDPADFGFESPVKAIRVIPPKQGTNCLLASKAAKWQLSERNLTEPTQEQADEFLAELSRKPHEERPVVPLYRVIGENGSTQILRAKPRDGTPKFAGFSRSEAESTPADEFFILAVEAKK